VADLGNITRSIRLQCQLCPWRPPDDTTMEAAQLHCQVDHDTSEVQLELVPVCSCGAAMIHTETKRTGGGFKDYVECRACGNTGFVKRAGHD
jgi:hypothetical protein